MPRDKESSLKNIDEEQVQYRDGVKPKERESSLKDIEEE